MGLLSTRRRSRLLAATALAALLASACGVDQKAPVERKRPQAAGMTFLLPAVWQRVAITGLAEADHMLALASVRPHGSLRTICNPAALTNHCRPGAPCCSWP